MSNIIEINNLNYQNLFENFNLNIENNKFITISGPNSCGKTTLIRILNREIITDNCINIFNRNINDYKIEEFSKIIQCIIPLEIDFQEINLQEELHYYEDYEELNTIIKKLKISKLLKKEFNELSEKEIILSQIVLALANRPKIILIDNLSEYFDLQEVNNILSILKTYKKHNNISIIYTTVELEESLNTDYIYIINDKKVFIEGEVLEVLKKDNVLNKIGLNIPFMIDLSVKLMDYELIDNLELETDRMVDLLWK